MAVAPRDTDDAFLREVDEGVRRDQMTSLWKRYGVAAIVVLVLGLAALAGWLWWRAEQQKAAGVAGEEFALAIDKMGVGDNAAARPVFDKFAKAGPDGYAPLALIMQAADAVSQGDNAKAIKLLDGIANDSKQAQPLRDLALLKSVRLGFDTQPPATIIARLKPLAAPGNPWFGIAGEMTALAHVKAGKEDLAKPILIAIVRDPANAASLRTRVGQLALSLGVDPAALQLPGDAARGAAVTPIADGAAQ